VSVVDRVLRVLVVDDSAFARKVVREILSRSPFLEVVGSARSVAEALDLTAELQPDVVTCDLIMPDLDGLAFVRQQMARHPVPIILISSVPDDEERLLSALEAGAVDFVQKPTALANDRMFEMGTQLVAKVKAVGTAPRGRLAPVLGRPVVSAPPGRTAARAVDVVVIGLSTGGPQALRALVSRLPADCPVPVAVVLHMPPGYTAPYALKLDGVCALTVTEAVEGDRLERGRVLLAPGGQHLSLRRHEDRVVAHLDSRRGASPHRPSVDVLFQSAVEVYGSRVLGVVMTGMGADGREGAASIKARGGTILTEAEDTCVVYGMPRSVVEAGLSDASIPLEAMATAILERL
jgi:two-component system, chemotaxis family, protein-glutamate methylesterase/glutaminase